MISDGSFSGSAFQYAMGPGLYLVLAFVALILSILFLIVFIIGRYCCCCCSKKNWCCVTLQCGAHEPTTKMCGCGVAPVAADSLAPPNYTCFSKVLAYIFLIGFVVAVS